METKLKKYGANSQAIVIPKAILEFFKIGKNTVFEFKSKNDKFVIEAKSVAEEKFEKSWNEVSDEFSGVFKSLADK